MFQVEDTEAWYVEEEWNALDGVRAPDLEIVRTILQSPHADYAAGLLTEFPRSFQRNRPIHHGDARLQAYLLGAVRYLMMSAYDRNCWVFIPVGGA